MLLSVMFAVIVSKTFLYHMFNFLAYTFPASVCTKPLKPFRWLTNISKMKFSIPLVILEMITFKSKCVSTSLSLSSYCLYLCNKWDSSKLVQLSCNKLYPQIL